MKKFLLLFIPHEKNNHRASLLKPSVLALFIAVYLFNQSLIKTLTITNPGVLGYSSEITARKVFDMTNQKRINNDLPIYHYNSTLSQSAQKKAQDMFESDYWAHTSPSGTTPWDFFKEVGYKYSIAGENLAKDFYETDSMMDAWMNSPTHKANIVNQKYKEIGIAVVDGVLGGVKTTLVVQHFGTPINQQITNITPDEISYNSSIETKNTDSQQNSHVLAASSTIKSINPLLISKIIGSIFFVLIIITLIIDSYITLKNNTHRLTGSSASHIAFLLIILLFMLFSRQGTIF
jgi:uncharacterized protein YkwD